MVVAVVKPISVPLRRTTYPAMPASSVAAVHCSASDVSPAVFSVTTGRVGGLCSAGACQLSPRSNTACLSERESWWSSTAIDVVTQR